MCVRYLVDGVFVVGVVAVDGDLVADFGGCFFEVDHGVVHADAADDGGVFFANFDVTSVAEAAVEAFVVAQWDDADAHGLWGGEGVVVADLVAFLEVDDVGDGAGEGECWFELLELLVVGVCSWKGVDAIESNTEAHGVGVSGLGLEAAGGLGDVKDCWFGAEGENFVDGVIELTDWAVDGCWVRAVTVGEM